MQIYIPSSGRAGEQHTLKQIPTQWMSRTALVVPNSEYTDYCPVAAEAGCTVIPCPHKGIGPTRQFIIAAAYPEPVLMLDDDLTFFRRRVDDPTKFEDAFGSDILQMLDSIENHLKDYPLVGVCAREGGNRYPNQFYYNGRLLRVLGYDTITLSKHDIDFRTLPVMEDFYVALSLLTRGYENLMLSNWCHNQRGSNESGGCSQYRTMEMQADAANMLKQYFPKFVTVVKKQTKTAWGGQERTDVRIQWKRAYTHSGRTNGTLDKPPLDNSPEERSG